MSEYCDMRMACYALEFHIYHKINYEYIIPLTNMLKFAVNLYYTHFVLSHLVFFISMCLNLL